MDIQHAFTAQLVDHTGGGTLTDGSTLWEVVSRSGDRIGSCSTEEAAEDLAMALNLALTDWVEADESDRTA